MPTEPAVAYQFPCLFGFYLIQKYSFCLLKSLPLTYVHFLWQAVFTHGNSKFQIHQCVSTKRKHTSSAASHKLTERSTRLLVAPGTSDTSNPSTGWQRAVAISREILIFFLMWLSIELQTKVRFRIFPWARPHQSFWWQFYSVPLRQYLHSLVYLCELNGYHNLKMKNTCIVTSQNSHTFALWRDITDLDSGKAQGKKSSL